LLGLGLGSGLLSLLATGGFWLPPLLVAAAAAVGLGLPTWAWARADLRAMAAGRRGPRGRLATQCGLEGGRTGTLLGGGVLVAYAALEAWSRFGR
jgi:hypothetical protein